MEIEVTNFFLEDLASACNCIEPWKDIKEYIGASDIKSIKFDRKYIEVNGTKILWETFVKYDLMRLFQ